MATPTPPADSASILVQRLIEEAWNRGNVQVVDELVAEHFVEHPLWPNPLLHGPDDDPAREQIKHDIAMFRAAFPDLSITIDQLIRAEDKVIVVDTRRGTPKKGDHPITWAEMAIYRVADGKLAEVWWLRDRLGFWQQLGLVPPTRELHERFPM